MDTTLHPEALLIVTGSHLHAEVHDRPLAYFLRERVLAALGGEAPEDRVVVCGDLWYMNHPPLRRHAVVSLGAPEHSALAAYFASRVPSALAVDGVYVVQLDLDAEPPVASCWGATPEATATAAHAFADRLLEAFLGAAAA